MGTLPSTKKSLVFKEAQLLITPKKAHADEIVDFLPQELFQHSIPDMLLLGGGLPIITQDKQHIGSIGISGATPE